MGTRTLYFDEAGFTGSNLLDPQQPFFAIASTDIDDASADAILTGAFPRYRGAEVKFSAIWNSTNRKGLIPFARAFAESGRDGFVYMINKRFAVLTKLVDFLIEPYVTDAGYDFYADGFCWKYCNYIHFGFEQFAPPELLSAVVRAYQRFSRDPTRENLHGLQTLLGIMAGSTEQPVQVFLEQMELGARLLDRRADLSLFRGSDDLQMTTMVAIVCHWRQRYPEDFAVVHDASSNFLRSKAAWDCITNPDVPRQMHRSGDGSETEWPLRVISTTAVDSRASRAIQCCDLIAGLSNRHFDANLSAEDRAFLDEVIDAGLKGVPFNGIRPETVFPDQIPPRRRAGPDIVDQMTGIIFGAHNAARPRPTK